jgi:SAM-dependent methyltransferase
VGLSGAGEWLTRRLALPLTVARDVDDPHTTAMRREVVRGKPFLRRIYDDWYRTIADALPPGKGAVLELGSGAGFMRDLIPEVVASDVMSVPGIALVADAAHLPFSSGSLRAVVMTNVLHHLPSAAGFLADAARCVRPGGRLVMIEPWVTRWSTFVYRRVHPEPFEPGATDWNVVGCGPLSAANGALPWILFERDRERFEREFPEWRIHSIEPQMPFRYLVSGGVSLRCLVPSSSYGAWRALEAGLGRWRHSIGMFARIVVVRTEVAFAPEGAARGRENL